MDYSVLYDNDIVIVSRPYDIVIESARGSHQGGMARGGGARHTGGNGNCAWLCWTQHLVLHDADTNQILTSPKHGLYYSSNRYLVLQGNRSRP